MNWPTSGKHPEIEHDAISSRRYKEDFDDAIQQLINVDAQLKELGDFAFDLQTAFDKEKARLDWLEQLKDPEIICELVVNWKSRNRHWPAGLRDAIDAAMNETPNV